MKLFCQFSYAFIERKKIFNRKFWCHTCLKSGDMQTHPRLFYSFQGTRWKIPQVCQPKCYWLPMIYIWPSEAYILAVTLFTQQDAQRWAASHCSSHATESSRARDPSSLALLFHGLKMDAAAPGITIPLKVSKYRSQHTSSLVTFPALIWIRNPSLLLPAHSPLPLLGRTRTTPKPYTGKEQWNHHYGLPNLSSSSGMAVFTQNQHISQHKWWNYFTSIFLFYLN